VGGGWWKRWSPAVGCHSSSSPVEGEAARADDGGWRRRSVGVAAGGVEDGRMESGTGGCVVIMRNSVIFVVNCNSPTDSDHWKWIEFLVSIPWAAKQQASWNPIEFGLIPVNQTCSKRFVNFPRIGGMDNIEPSPNGIILLVSNGAVVTLELNGS
jgi:hypothetical protein